MHEIRLFGELAVTTRGVRLTGRDLGGVAPRHILALLALHGTLSRTDLVELLWEGRPPGDHVRPLEENVAVLRHRLDPDAPGTRSVVTSGVAGYALDPERVRTDVARFDELMAAAVGRTARQALRPLTAAAHVAGRPLLADVANRGWAAEAREHYRNRLVEALLGAAHHALAVGEYAAATDLTDRVLALEPAAVPGVRRALYRARPAA